MIIRSVSAMIVCLFVALGNGGQLIADTPLKFMGDFIPGALIIGETLPGTTITQDGNPVRVSTDGKFLLGLNRDASGTTELIINGLESKKIAIAPRDYEIQRIDGLPTNQVTPNPETVARTKRERVFITDARKLDSEETWFDGGFMWPITGPISGVFGSQRILNGKPRSPHNGVDIAAPRGSSIVAMGDGRVVVVHDDMFYTGKTVMIDHGHGLTSVYIHMDSILVEQGTALKKGTPLGTVGKTGRTTGPHLHWGVTLFSTHLDPMLVAGEMPE